MYIVAWSGLAHPRSRPRAKKNNGGDIKKKLRSHYIPLFILGSVTCDVTHQRQIKGTVYMETNFVIRRWQLTSYFTECWLTDVGFYCIVVTVFPLAKPPRIDNLLSVNRCEQNSVRSTIKNSSIHLFSLVVCPISHGISEKQKVLRSLKQSSR